MRGTRLYADEKLRVLWLTRRRHELALSADGVWLRAARRSAELSWDDIDQLQVTRVPLWPARAWVDVFARDGDERVGPFPHDKAMLWMAACGAALRDAGRATQTLARDAGFSLRRSG